ncbi:hypothetical protein H5410_040388 [Solanum commersonii]|uniref:Uncharacterized protein n=1 Tax=Solanum commersonii TaxID=4109 RepID=A0A9J5XQ04_SOLCO|nr:hypothetical protein H5410_040388 [Solanum commersonii]
MVIVANGELLVDWEGFSKLKQLPNLKILDLQFNPIHPKVLLSSLCWISSLEILKLGAHLNTSFNVLTTYNSSISSYSIVHKAIFGQWTEEFNVEKLILNNNNFNSTIFSSLKIFPSLKHLNLASNEINGNIEMNGNKRMSSLRNLQLGSSYSNSSRVIQSLKSFSSLKSLSYEFSDLTSPTITYAIRNLSTMEYRYVVTPQADLEDTSAATVEKHTQQESGVLKRSKRRSLMEDHKILKAHVDDSIKEVKDSFSKEITEIRNILMEVVSTKVPMGTHRWCELKHIEELDFLNNNFEGTLPSCLGNFTSLRWLSLAGNNLRGNIASHSIWIRLKSLEFLDIANNQFEVPLSFSQFSNYTKLIYLNVAYNTIITDTEFQNWIPNFQLEFFAIQRCINLQKLPSLLHYQYDLSILAIGRNQLQGNFPTWLLENNTRLVGIYGRYNAFSGPFKLPSSRHLHLETIDVSNNKLNGHIPENMSIAFPKISSLNMSQNLLEGAIPSKICRIHLKILDLSVNLLSGEVPSVVKEQAEWTNIFGGGQTKYIILFIRLKRHFHDNHGILSDIFLMGVENQVQFSTKRNLYAYKGIILKYMSGIDLSSNRLTSEIPVDLGNMSTIHTLNLSHNHLIGRIPNTFSNLHEIESLDLSYNRLNGSIPVGLLELNYLAVFSVAYNNLSGAVPDFKAQFGTFDKSSYEGNPFLCGYPLDNKCGRSPKLSNSSNINGGEESSDLEDITLALLCLMEQSCWD